MNPGSDILVYDQNNSLVLAIESKKKLNASVAWASEFRHNILAHGLLPYTKFFLIATPDRLFIWKDSGMNSFPRPPIKVVDAQPIFAPYFEQLGIPAEEISGSSFELILISWLAELLYSGITPMQVNRSYQWLDDLGIYKAIEGGHIGQGVPA